jgi:hypothetical protein
MLRPTKHSHPDQTVMHAATIVLRHLRKKRLESFDSLRSLLRDRISGADFLFMPALNLLFVLGLVQYLPKVDSFEYIGA